MPEVREIFSPLFRQNVNQISLMGIVSIKAFHVRPCGWHVKSLIWVCMSKWGHVCRGNGLGQEVGFMGTSGNRDSQLASRNVLNDFNDDALVISARCLF